ncbi:glycosyltransferase family 2 protein [Nocardioides sp. B-3]|uniref:glycosyltransferase family 2 protein n=1 Tax=Nocardioides sp. B-3 TaxID=2895565 RepID=UPI002152F19C|nr:glycosyltransferase family 2 protein [Nocardioides sp. B-3]UUZ58109.1 glycosyltransferase family 2 protein [Nocardioides sp. B-3]
MTGRDGCPRCSTASPPSTARSTPSSRSTPAVATRAPTRSARPGATPRCTWSRARRPTPGQFRAALATLPALTSDPSGDDEWIWLLHDDANPDPDALLALTLAIEEYPDADILGPKLREWPSLRRLLEVGLTITGTGHRETGLERGEYDRGQHDEPRRVPAVNTAGMLVRRRVLEELGGFDDELPIFGNDIDFGWRAAQAGHITMVIPQAVLFHAEAAHRGVRRTPLTGRHTHYRERRAALFTLLANAPSRRLPWQLVRLFLGSLLRVLGFPAVRSVGEALDELAAVLSVYSRPGHLLAGRRARASRRGQESDVRSLLAPVWLPYRHGLDFVTDPAAAATNPGIRRCGASPCGEAGGLAAGGDRRAPRCHRRGGRAPPGLRDRRRVRHQPRRDGADPLRGAGRHRGAAPPSARLPAGRCRRCRPTPPTGGGCTSSRGIRSAPAPTCRPLPTSCPSPCSRRCSAAAPAR